jgi:hypothetical protein
MRMNEPGLKEDALNLTLIGGSACVAALLTAGFLFANSSGRHEVRVVRVAEPPPASIRYEIETPLSGTNRLYGTVHTRDGEAYTGYIRWDRNEGSWTDLLDATKPRPRGGANLAGIRFGHIDRIDVLGRNAARFMLRSGEDVELTGNATDLGTGLRAMVVSTAAGDRVTMGWNSLEAIDFTPAPAGLTPPDGRMFGTLRTRSGLEFTGYVTWDVDEIYSSDILDGDLDGDRQKVPFGAIESISRESSRAARVVLHSGEQMVLDGTNDVDRSNSGISVSDPALGQVEVVWDDFESMRFHGTDAEATYSDFDGGRRLRGTVVTENGRELSGAIRWDNDEAYSWEMLNGDADGVEFDIEFGQIARITRTDEGARVTLRDGRTFELGNSNDVDDGNRGIVVGEGDGVVKIAWDNFRELRLEG